jgi:dihydroorotate dehydrogenase electron transfer subunit
MGSDPNCFTTEVCRKKHSGENCTSLFFRANMQAVPGQFVMVWAPGVDEVPMSLSHIGAGEIGVTVKDVGEATNAICSMQKGERVRIRGPFGRGFTLKGRNPLMVAGGVGSAPLLPLARALAEKGMRATVIIGAKSKGELVLLDEFKDTGLEVMMASDDGSIGHHGTASDLLAQTLDGIGNYDAVYACGPEQMLVLVVKIANKWSLWGQAALERLMKCGIGLCGSCAINHKLVCRDGPVFDFSELRALPDFGNVKRDAAGRARLLTGR